MTRSETFLNSLLFFLMIGSVAVAPPEATLLNSQKILYLKLGCISSTYALVVISFIVTLVSIFSDRIIWKVISKEALELAFYFCTASIIMGALWAKFAWNTFFSFEPRLISFLILWFFLLSTILVQKDGPKSGRFYSLVSILSLLTIPLVKYSIDWLPEELRLHPQILARGGMQDISFKIALWLSMGFTFFLSLTLLKTAVRIQTLEYKFKYG